MAKSKNSERDSDSEGRQRQLDLMARGEGIEGGWCVDFDHPEVVYKCSEEEQAVARGELSVSFDRSKVLDLQSGELVEREPDFRRGTMGQVDLAGDVPTAGGDNVTGNTGGTSSGGGAAGNTNP